MDNAWEHIRRAYQTLRACNQLLVRAEEEFSFLQQICDAIVEIGAYPLAWVGYTRYDEQYLVEFMAKAGRVEYLDNLTISWSAEHPLGQGPTGKAIRSGEPQLSLVSDSTYYPWHEAALRWNFTASLAMPLLVDDRIIGVLNVYTSAPESFNDEELDLLKHLAQDMAYGLMTLRARERQKKAEAALRRSEEGFRLLTEHAHDLIYRYRLYPSPGFEYVSPASTRMTGYTPEDHYADPQLGFKMVHPDDLHLLQTASQQPGDLLLRWITKDGRVIWTEQHNVPIYDEEGRLIALEGIARDVTERRRAARLAVAGEIAAGVAHQINNPLTTVIAETFLLMKKYPSNSPTYESLAMIREAAERAGNIVQRLLNMARLHSEKKTTIDLNQSLKRAVEMIHSQFPPDIHLTFNLEPNLPTIIGSEDHLLDVWINLLLNARDALIEQGNIRITTHALPTQIQVSITDDGPGIAPRDIEHLFDPFFTTKEHGTGLGLPICHDVITQHRGQIAVSSAVGEGTTFTIYLPIS